MMIKVAVSVVLMVLLAGFSGMAAAADDARAQDRAEIEALMWRYVRALDSLDAEAYAAVFTEDGQFGAGGNATKGREALKQMVEGLAQNRAEDAAPMYHVIANSYLEFVDENTARFQSYWMTVFGAAGQGTAPRVAAAGRGVDDLVRVNGEWLIKSRNVAPQD
jgi:uncharacterized protein (TIGR02246 family)